MKNNINRNGIKKTISFREAFFANCRKRFLLISFILTCVTGDVTVEQQKIMAREGSSVTLKCIVTSDDKPTLRWFYNEHMINPYQEKRYALSNTTDQNPKPTRTYNLQIKSVLSRDDGMYTCVVIFTGGTDKRQIRLAVKYLNKSPFVSCQLSSTSNTSTHHRSNRETEKTKDQIHKVNIVSCEANLGNNIFINVTIMKSVYHEHPISLYNANAEQSNAADGVKVNYQVDVNGLDGWQFWCVARHPMMLRPINSSTPVLMKPTVKIVKNGDQFKCEVESYPDATFFQWIICENETENFEVEECAILDSRSSNVTLKDIGAVDDVLLICEAQNAVGTGQGNMTITGHTEPTDITLHSEHADITITRHTESTSNKKRGSYLVMWSITGGFVFLFGLALTLISFYFGKESRYIRRYVTQETPVTIKKVKKSDACFDIMPEDAYSSRQIAAAELESLYANPVKTKTQCTFKEYHSESKYDLCGPSKSEYDICGHTSMAETQPLYRTLEDPTTIIIPLRHP